MDHCQFSHWYPLFKALTFKSIVLPLPNAVVDYLKADGIYLLEDHDPDSEPPFPEFQLTVKKAIETLGGKVFPKLNWSSPKDASWMTLDGRLQCEDISSVFLLLKSSDFVVHDMDIAEDYGLSLELVLRKWVDLIPSMEFRCFVKEKKIVAISQRDDTNFYPFLLTLRTEIEERIHALFSHHVQSVFELKDYVMDVYVAKQGQKSYIMDFNPFLTQTDSLLFEWSELETTTDYLGLRLIASQMEATQHTQPAYTSNRLPKDMFDLSNDCPTIEQVIDRLTLEIQKSC